MPVRSIPEDKPKIMFYAAMMFIQNFGFFLMYFQMYKVIPDLESGDCETLRYWVGFFALDCFVESVVCVWMGMGGYTDDGCLFPSDVDPTPSRSPAILPLHRHHPTCNIQH